jgi:hypothetical protein
VKHAFAGRVKVVKVHSIGVSQSLGSTASSPQVPPATSKPQPFACAACRIPHGGTWHATPSARTMSCALASRRPRHVQAGRRTWPTDSCNASLKAGPRKPTPPFRLIAAAPRRARLTDGRAHAAGAVMHQELRGSGRSDEVCDGHTCRASTRMNKSGSRRARPWFGAPSSAISTRSAPQAPAGRTYWLLLARVRARTRRPIFDPTGAEYVLRPMCCVFCVLLASDFFPSIGRRVRAPTPLYSCTRTWHDTVYAKSVH